MNDPLRKRRTREHIIADLSVNHVERVALRVGYTTLRIQQDYGLDLQVSTFNRQGEVEPGSVYFQLKATDQISRMRRGKFFALSVDPRDAAAWVEEFHPVILILFDARRERAYWLHVQEYFRSLGAESGGSFRAFRSIRIPASQLFTEEVMMRFAEQKNIMYRQPKGWFSYGKQTDHVW